MHYLLGSLFLLTIWLLIFISQKKLRKEMLVASILITPAAFSEVFFVPGYWLPDTIGSPKLSIEDFIFTFAVGGIIAVIYELFMKGKVKHQRLCNCFNGGLFPGAHNWMLRIWKLSSTSEGVIIFKHIPWTEMLWGLSWGLVWGPMYEFLVGARTITFSKK